MAISLINQSTRQLTPIRQCGGNRTGSRYLTRKLLEAGQTVHAVELDRRLADNLENTETEAVNSKKLTITRGDAVKLPLGSLPESVNQYAIVANLPYAISSAWLESVLSTENPPKRMVLMMQREAVDRIWQNLEVRNTMP